MQSQSSPLKSVFQLGYLLAKTQSLTKPELFYPSSSHPFKILVEDWKRFWNAGIRPLHNDKEANCSLDFCNIFISFLIYSNLLHENNVHASIPDNHNPFCCSPQNSIKDACFLVCPRHTPSWPWPINFFPLISLHFPLSVKKFRFCAEAYFKIQFFLKFSQKKYFKIQFFKIVEACVICGMSWNEYLKNIVSCEID